MLCNYFFFFFSEEVLQESEVVGLSTQLTTVGSLLPEDIPSTSTAPVDDQPLDQPLTEGWQKTWEGPAGIFAPNIPWLKSGGLHSIFQSTKSKTGKKIFKARIDFQLHPLPTSIRGSLPSMLSFFTTPIFFWRPVGVMEALIRWCPNQSCPAPPGTYLSRSGYGDVAREVCGLEHNYTLLTERLKWRWRSAATISLACLQSQHPHAACPCSQKHVPGDHMWKTGHRQRCGDTLERPPKCCVHEQSAQDDPAGTWWMVWWAARSLPDTL